MKPRPADPSTLARLHRVARARGQGSCPRARDVRGRGGFGLGRGWFLAGVVGLAWLAMTWLSPASAGGTESASGASAGGAGVPQANHPAPSVVLPALVTPPVTAATRPVGALPAALDAGPPPRPAMGPPTGEATRPPPGPPPKPDRRPPGPRSAARDDESAARLDSASGSLERNDMLFASTNLLRSGTEERRLRREEESKAEFGRLLETGRRLRVAGLHEEATPNLSSILTGGAPDEFQRAALIELALVAQDQGNLPRALQVYSQYLSRWPQDTSAPEILLRQGLIYRQLGLHSMATTKFYATMTAALTVKDGAFDYYKRLVLQAQAEIAETLALQNQHEEAAGAFARLLKEESPALQRSRVHYRYIQTLTALGRLAESVGQSRQFLIRNRGAEEEAEVRFLLATSLKKLNRNSEAVREILNLLQLQQPQAQEHPEILAYWQQRTGNEIANQLYQEGDFIHALDVYASLLLLNPRPEWQSSVRYQIGLAYERLEQPAKAAEAYGAILALEPEIGTNAPPGLKATLEMARWRQGFLRWQDKADQFRRDIGSSLVAPSAAVGSGTVTNSL